MRRGLLCVAVAACAVAGCAERNPDWDAMMTGSDASGGDDTDGGDSGDGGPGGDDSGGPGSGSGSGGMTGDDGSASGTGSDDSASGTTTGDPSTSGGVDTTGTSGGGCETCADPIIHLAFDGNADNLGTLGSAFDGVGQNVTYVAGIDGMAAEFGNAVDSLVTIPGTRAPLSSSFTYTMGWWFREDNLQNPAFFMLDFRNSPGGGGFHTYHGVSSPNLYQCWSGSPTGSGCQNFAYGLGEWHHVMYRCEGTALTAPGGCDVEILLDNQLVATLSTGGSVIFSPSQAMDLVLGRETNFQIDELKIYDAVFTPDEQCEHVIGGAWSGTDCLLP